ncbi:MAG TPA: hypothetical protein VMW24_24270 [Sedimentisphaerales bacterium]|nr:hypothetical protein [Sedimentisphaerales bacterium]
MNAEDIIKATRGVTNKWAKQRKAEERQASRIYNRRYVMTRSYRTTIKEVAWEVMKEAYLKASSDGKYPAHARQIMYAARPRILEKADNCDSLDDAYFTQQLLPDYMQEHPETLSWDVVFDARGHLCEPHTKKEVALGTLDVRHYLHSIKTHTVMDIMADVVGGDSFPTMGPNNRYSAILFIEKEGFMPLFQKARIAEKYDVAIMSSKGMSTTAARLLVDNLCLEGVPLLVLHDFDKAGFSIVGTLKRDTRRYTFSNDVNVIDLGLHLKDIKTYDLVSEQCVFGKTDPGPNLRENGATEDEIEFLCNRADSYRYYGKRVELNAFSSGDFVEWIEGKLKEQAIKKVIPDSETLDTAYRRAALVKKLEDQIEEFIEESKKEIDDMKLDGKLITRMVQKMLKRRPDMSWDKAIMDIAGSNGDGVKHEK